MSQFYNEQQLDELFEQSKYYKMLEAINFALKIKEYCQRLFLGDIHVNFNTIETADNVNEFTLTVNIYVKSTYQLNVNLSTTQDRVTFLSEYYMLEKEYFYLKSLIQHAAEQNVIRQQAVAKLTEEEKRALGLI